MNDDDGTELQGYQTGDSAEGKGSINISGGFAQEVQGGSFGLLDSTCNEITDAVIGQALER